MAGEVQLPNHVTFKDDDGTTYELQLVGGASGIAESSSQPSTLSLSGGGARYGDFEPNFSQIEQRTWVGGRGNEDFVNDQTRYYDGKAAWGLTEDKLFPAPLERFARGLRTTDQHLTDDKTWKKLTSDTSSLYIAVQTGAITADKVFIWIRRRGTPGTLTLKLIANNAGNPTGSTYQTVTKTTTNITDTISVFQEFDWTSTQAMSANDWIVVYGASTDTSDSCWEVAVDADTATSKTSTDGASWTAASYKLLYRLTDADIKRKFLGFELEGALYAVSANDDGTASKLYINGGRGTASSATSTTLTDSGIGWTADRFNDAWVRIIGGTGKGQTRQITDSTTDTLTVATWDITPDGTSRYVIYKTPWFTEITSTSLGTVKSVAVLNNIAYFAQGASDNIRRMYDNAGTHTFADDSTNKADLLAAFPDSEDGPQMWRALNGTTMEVSRADKQAWGADLSFGTGISVGDASHEINNLAPYDGRMWVFKEDKPYYIQNDRAESLEVGLEGIPGPETGQAVAVQGLFLYFSWWKSFERAYGQTIDDVGIWRGTGLPSGRDGEVCALTPLGGAWLFVGIDAGTGTSSVYIFNDEQYHEVFRGYTAGDRVRNVFLQKNISANPWLWINYNGELIYQEYSLTPLRETFSVQHEMVVESSVHDFGHAESFKFIKELVITAENLDSGTYIEVDYQKNTDVNSSTWYYGGTIYKDSRESVELNLGKLTRMKYRLRVYTETATTIPIINAIVLKGYEVVPVKRLWTMRVDVKSITSAHNKVNPDELYKWLWSACQEPGQVRMFTVWENIINGVYVRLEPPSTVWKAINKAAKWAGMFTLIVREM